MRVLILPRPEPVGTITSGIGRYVGNLEKHLGPDVQVLHLPGAPHAEDSSLFRPIIPPDRQSRRTLIQNRIIPASVRLIAGYVTDTVRLARTLAPFRRQVDLIHVNRVGCEIQPIAARLAGFRRIVATIHNLPGEDDLSRHWFRRWLERLSFACVDQLIAVSEATYESWCDRIGLRRDNVTVIHNGTDVAPRGIPARTEMRRRFGIADSATVFGICARIHPMKGHPVLIRAFARLVASHPDVRLMVAGEGPDEALLRQLITELGLDQSVRMLGHVSDPEVFMAAIDVNVLPSVTLETLGYSVVEAMHVGIPSIVSDVGGAKEIVGASGGGSVVPKGDVGALAAAMQAYAVDPERRAVEGRHAATYAREHLTGAHMAQATAAVYRALSVQR